MTNTTTTDTTVHTTGGAVRGNYVDDVVEFRGIPFSESVGGSHRMSAAVPRAHRDGVYEADTWTLPVPQVQETGGMTYTHLWSSYFDLPQSEDALSLNLWTASLDATAARPVLVWLHGGGFASGAPTRPREFGRSFADNGVVVVSPTHRLGAAGYLYLNGVTTEEYQTANLGMRDIVLALEWVRDNIREFGGDPANVTICGESGGAAKVHALLAMPMAKGLFSKGIIQSGAFSDFGGIRATTPEHGTEIATRFLEELGGGSLGPLWTASIDEFVAADLAATGGNLIAWSPVLDGATLPASPNDAVRDGAAADIPLLIGSSRYEMDVLGGEGILDSPRNTGGLSAEAYAELTAAYEKNHPELDEKERLRALTTDLMFRIAGIRTAESRARVGGAPAFMYLLDFDYSSDDFPNFRASHGSETAFAFNTVSATPVTAGDPAAARLATQVHSSWVAFLKTGSPVNRELEAWAPYDLESRSTTLLVADPHLESDPFGVDRAAWEKAFPSETAGNA
jgi:para-nitrobenzyl esterase